jgi:long-chain acyl-CoA synthetase
MRVKRAGQWYETTYSEMADTVHTLACGFTALGVGVGDRVALLSPNMPEWSQVDLAVQSIRGVTVPLYATSTDDQVQQIIENAGAEIAVAGTKVLAESLERVREMCGLPRRIIRVINEPCSESDMSFDELLAKGRETDSSEVVLRAAGAEIEDLATIIYTSGTTGEPKGVMLTHANFVNQFEHLDECFEVTSSDRSLCFLPLSHVFERSWSFFVYLTGLSNSFVPDPRRVAELLVEVRPTAMVAVPRLYEKVYSMVHSRVAKSPPLRQRIFHWAVTTGAQYQSDIRSGGASPWLKLTHTFADKLVLAKIRDAMGGPKTVMASGGAPLAKEVGEFMMAAGLLVCEGYGLTETAPMLTCNTPANFRFGAVGQPLSTVEIRIGENDEVLVRGPNIMKGYFRNPEATAEVMEGDWFRTGDVGHIDDDGFLVITDRLKDLIITSVGKNVAPQRVESMLCQDPYVEQLAVFGDKEKYLGALVVPSYEELKIWAGRQKLRFTDHHDLISLPEVVKFMNGRIAKNCGKLAPFERVRKITLLPNPFTMEKGEMTPTLKIRRKVVAATYGDLIKRMFL